MYNYSILLLYRFLLLVQEYLKQQELPRTTLLVLLPFSSLQYQVDLQVSTMRNYSRRVLNLQWFCATSSWVCHQLNLMLTCIHCFPWNVFRSIFTIIWRSCSCIQRWLKSFTSGFLWRIWLCRLACSHSPGSQKHFLTLEYLFFFNRFSYSG